MSIKNSEVIMAKEIKVDRDYKNVLNYSEQQMLDLVKANRVNGASNFGFVGDGFRNTIRVPFSYAECIQSNYLAFQNKFFANKWFFAWIDSVNYINDGTCELTFTVDSWSTWFSYWTPEETFVIREHVNNDAIGANTIPENVDVGEVVEESKDEFISLTNCYFCILTTYDPASATDFEGVQKINGTLFGYEVCLFDNDVASVENFLKATNKDGKIESVLALFMCPKSIFSSQNLHQITAEYNNAQYTYYRVEIVTSSGADNIVELPMPINATRSFSNFTPKNNKVYCYPYNYLLVTNGVGNQNIYKYENFFLENGEIATNISFAIQLAFSIGVSGRIVPRGYKKVDYNLDEALPLAKYPACSWASDAFTNWLTDNAVNIATQVITTGVAGISSVATGNVAGIVSTSGMVANLIGQFYQASLLPSITGGNNTGDVNFSANQNSVKFLHMRAKKEYLQIIDNYFTMYGYRVNRLKTPNITGRKNWNYIEITGASDIGFGTVPSIYMEEINNACRRGVTIWHNHATLGDYSQDNSII